MGANMLDDDSDITIIVKVSIDDRGNNIWFVTINDFTYRIYAPNPDTAIGRAMIQHYS